MKFLLFSLLASSVTAAVPSLTTESYETATAGKTVFIKFFAPWCGHCQAMADDWEKLASEWSGHEVGYVAEVDCTIEENTPLCQENDVQGFPTLKYGSPSALMDYEGGRSYEELVEFAKENLKPICSPSNLEPCSDDEKAEIEKYQAMSLEELNKGIQEVQEKIESKNSELEGEIQKLQDTYEKLMEKHDASIKEITSSSNYSMLKAVRATKSQSTTGSDEL